MSTTAFSTTALKTALLENLTSLGYEQMTPIQAQALPHILAGKDVIAQAKTGSGKTAAFALGLLQQLDVKRFRIQSLVLCPTRELADQVANEIRKLARGIHNIKVLTLCGGSPIGPQIGSLEHGAHIIVGTPGRIEDHLSRERLDLSEVSSLVLDEADRMLEMGFQASLNFIFSHCPKQRQNLLFSATFPDEIKQISQHIMQTPVTIKVETNIEHNLISQHFYEVENNQQRNAAVEVLLLAKQPNAAVIFCNTKIEVQELANHLKIQGFSCLALHGDLEQRDRDQTLVKFTNQSARILVATDVASRGLDIDNVDAVINYHIAHDPEIHVHRIGRTGRAGKSGMAFSLISHKEAHKVLKLEEYLGVSVLPEALPTTESLNQKPNKAVMVTLQIDGGKKHKLRAGDILGALTAKQAIAGSQVGKIQLFDLWAYVAIERSIADTALKILNGEKMKGKSFRARKI